MGTIIVGTDGSEGGAKALQWAAREAHLRGWPLTVVMAWGLLDQHRPGRGSTFDPGYGEADALAALDAFVVEAIGAEAAAGVERRPVCDLPARALIEAAAGASLLVVGARGLGGFRGLLLGSVSQHCLRHAACPVAVVHEDEAARASTQEGASRRIVVAVDGSPASKAALGWALEEAPLRDAVVQAVLAWQFPGIAFGDYGGEGLPLIAREDLEKAATEVLHAAVAEVGGDKSENVTASPVEGHAAEALLKASENADLLVVGSRGHGGFAGLRLGSVSNHVAHHARCAVVVVKA